MQTWHYPEIKGLPPTLVLLPIKDLNEEMFFWTEDGPDMKGVKIGYEVGKSRIDEQVAIMKKVVPSFVDQDFERHDCYYSMTADNNPIIEKSGNKIYVTGLCGRGFKYMPMYGPMLYELMSGPDGPGRMKI